MILKLDLETPYDKLDWSFIKNILMDFNFPKDFSDLILECVSSTRASVLFNGGRLDQFLPSRGIRRGDLILPYIFILCMEYLSILIEKEKGVIGNA